VSLLRRLPLGKWIQTSRLVVMGGVVDGLRLLGVGTSVEFVFLFLDEGAVARPVSLVPTVDTIVWDFLPSAGVVSVAAVRVASVTPASSVFLRPGVACFVVEDRVHCLRGLRLLSLVRPHPVAVARPLLIHFFESSLLALV
jgi:hypothetical protein